MSVLGAEYDPLVATAEDWRSLASLMTGTSRDLAGQGTGSLPPSVQGAASSFLSAWSGYAEESAAIAEGFAASVDARVTDYSGADDGSRDQMTDLDGRLGPAR